MEKHIYFVRHGESDSNKDGIFRGYQSMLTEFGREQARIVAERIERIGVEALVSSTLPRALDTATAISKRIGQPIEENDVFVEWREPSAIHMRHRDEPEVQELHNKLLNRHDNPHHRQLDEETVAELKERAVQAFRFLDKHVASRICVVTHGAYLRILLGTVLFGNEFNPSHFKDFFQHLVTSNTGVSYMRNLKPEFGWQLVSWNDSAHLG